MYMNNLKNFEIRRNLNYDFFSPQFCLAALVGALAAHAHGAAEADSVSYQYVRHGAPAAAYPLLHPYYHPSRLAYPAYHRLHPAYGPAYAHAHPAYGLAYRHRIHKRAAAEDDDLSEAKMEVEMEAEPQMDEAAEDAAEARSEVVSKTTYGSPAYGKLAYSGSPAYGKLAYSGSPAYSGYRYGYSPRHYYGGQRYYGGYFPYGHYRSYYPGHSYRRYNYYG